jgi:hypothetical protein
MTDRPWDAARLIESDLADEPFFSHDKSAATGLHSVAVDFKIVPTRPYEEERFIGSSFTLDENGTVSTLDIRLPAVTDESIGKDALAAAGQTAVERSALPDDTNVVVRGSPGRWDVHFKFPHGEIERTPGTGFGSTGLAARTAVRAASRVLDVYHEEVGKL